MSFPWDDNFEGSQHDFPSAMTALMPKERSQPLSSPEAIVVYNYNQQ